MSFVEKNIEFLTELEYKYPNDMEFGYEIRLHFRSDEFVLDIPNDQLLGKAVRKIIKKL